MDDASSAGYDGPDMIGPPMAGRSCPGKASLCIMDMQIFMEAPYAEGVMAQLECSLGSVVVFLSCGHLKRETHDLESTRFIIETSLSVQEVAALVLAIEGVEQVTIEPWSRDVAAASPPIIPDDHAGSRCVDSAFEVLHDLVRELDRSSGISTNLILDGGSIPLEGAEPTELGLTLFHLVQHLSMSVQGPGGEGDPGAGVAILARRSATRVMMEVSALGPSMAASKGHRSHHLAAVERMSMANGWRLSFPEGTDGIERAVLRLGPGTRNMLVMVALDAGRMFAVPVRDILWVIGVPASVVHDREVLFQGSRVPLVRLNEPEEGAAKGLILSMNGDRACLLVSEVLGPRDFLPDMGCVADPFHPFICDGVLDCFIKAPLLDTARLLRSSRDRGKEVPVGSQKGEQLALLSSGAYMVL